MTAAATSADRKRKDFIGRTRGWEKFARFDGPSIALLAEQREESLPSFNSTPRWYELKKVALKAVPL